MFRGSICSGPTIQFRFAVRSFTGVNANCPVYDSASLTFFESSHPSTTPAVALNQSVNVYDASPPVCVSGIASPKR